MTASASGCCAHSAKLAQSSIDSHCSATPSNWKSSMYHDFSRWSSPARRTRPGARPTGRRGGRRVGRERSDAPRQRRAPVVAHHVGALDAEVVEDGDHVGGEERERVRVDGRRARRTAPKPRRSGTMTRKPGVDQRGHLRGATGARSRGSRAAARPAARSPSIGELDADAGVVDPHGGSSTRSARWRGSSARLGARARLVAPAAFAEGEQPGRRARARRAPRPACASDPADAQGGAEQLGVRARPRP